MNDQSKARSSSPLGVGVITIFMVLIVMCLFILAALSLSTARGDLYLSEKNADTVSAYYAADAVAAELFDSFAEGTEDSFYDSIPMTENQSLYVSFGRDDNGNPVVYAWQTISLMDDSVLEDDTLPIWQGD